MTSRSTAPDHPNLRVITTSVGPKRYKTKKIYHYPHLSKGQDFNVFNADIFALEKAAKERLFYVKDAEGGFVEPPTPTPDVFSVELGPILRFMTGHGIVTAPLTNEKFIGAYEGRRRTVYQNAMNSLLVRPLEPKDAMVKFFVKIEKTNFTKKPNSVPRGISPRDPRYHVSLGPYIKRIEKLVYKRINELWGSPTIMKGKNALERGAAVLHHWKKYKDPVAVGVDASRFDQHVHIDALKFEHLIYLSYFRGKHRKQLERLLSMQLVNKGVGYVQDGKLKFTLVGKRMSGDMNTALGNCTLMSTMIKYVVEQLSIKCSFINDGDDGVIFLERRDYPKLRQHLYNMCLKFGHEVVLEDPVHEIEQIEFCQSKFVFRDATTLVAVRDIKSSFDKDSISLLHLCTPKFASKWMRSVGDCGLSLTQGLPVLQSYYNHFRQYSETGLKTEEITGMKLLSKGMGSPKLRPITDISRYSFWKAFGVPPSVQLELEQHYESMITSQVVSTNYITFPHPIALL